MLCGPVLRRARLGALRWWKGLLFPRCFKKPAMMESMGHLAARSEHVGSRPGHYGLFTPSLLVCLLGPLLLTFFPFSITKAHCACALNCKLLLSKHARLHSCWVGHRLKAVLPLHDLGPAGRSSGRCLQRCSHGSPRSCMQRGPGYSGCCSWLLGAARPTKCTAPSAGRRLSWLLPSKVWMSAWVHCPTRIRTSSAAIRIAACPLVVLKLA